jgi:hypothetical protein
MAMAIRLKINTGSLGGCIYGTDDTYTKRTAREWRTHIERLAHDGCTARRDADKALAIFRNGTRVLEVYDDRRV